MWLPALALLLILTLSVWPMLVAAEGQFNLHVAQAGAWLHGRTDVPPGADVAAFNGRNYVSFPPFPSLLVLPVVAMAGVPATNTVLIALLLSALNIALLLLICRAWQIDLHIALWASAGFILGSAYWQAVFNSGGVWNFSHVVSVTCGLAAIYAAKRTGLGLPAGLFVGLSFLTRQLTIFLAIFVMMVLWQHPRSGTRSSRWVQLALFSTVIAICVAAYLGYNTLRFSDPLQTGYAFMPLSGFLKERFDHYGLFNLHYLPFNLYYLLLAGFELTFAPPAYLHPPGLNPFGTSITFASPFIFTAFMARGNRRLLLAAWISIALIFTPQLFYYNNGWMQYNAQRFTLDAWPALFVLIVLGAQHTARLPNPQPSFSLDLRPDSRNEVPRRLWRAAILFAIALNAITWAILTKVI